MTEHLAIDAILQRVEVSSRETYARLGQPPQTFLVTPQEYELLQRWHGPDWTPVLIDQHDLLDVRLFGMRVVTSEYIDWYRDNLYMEHFRACAQTGWRALQVWEPLPCAPESLERCRVARPPHPCREVTCPCGEVIWVISRLDPGTWFMPSSGLADTPSRPRHVDSEKSSFEEWVAAVDALLKDHV